jgi:hypothetical protein
MGVAYVSHLCCKCWMLHMFHTYVASVSSRCHIFAIAIYVFSSCFKRMLQVFQMYVVNILSRCCKSRTSVVHIAVVSICSSRLLQLSSTPACTWYARGVSGKRGKWAQIEAERRGTRSNAGHGAAWDTMWPQDTERHEPQVKHV